MLFKENAALRDYQITAINCLREKLKTIRSCVLQLPTGAGKTCVVSEIAKQTVNAGKKIWFIVPRRELVRQTKKQFSKWNISFGIIDAENKENRSRKAHIISLQTLIRRLDKIKNFPDICVFDECHINYDLQKKIMALLPDDSKIIGVTATPSRQDNRGLGLLYNDIIYGCSIPALTAQGFLTPLKYYAPPVDGIKDLKIKRHTNELDNKELDDFFTERKIYGYAVDYYEKLGKTDSGAYRRAVGFCAGIEAAKKQAEKFRERGFIAEHIEGGMPKTRQHELLDGLANGDIQVLCSADLLLYGWDSPNVSYGFLLRRTASKALYFQMVGRILRTAEGKSDTIFVDHTSNIDLHTDPEFPGVPPFYLENVTWNFHAEKDTKPKVVEREVRLCAYDNYAVCTKKIRCKECELYVPDENEIQEELIEENIELEKRADNVETIYLPETKQECLNLAAETARLAKWAVQNYDKKTYEKAVFLLRNIAMKLNYKPLWVYHQIKTDSVDEDALYKIAFVYGYKRGWAWHKAQELRTRT